MPRSFLPSTIGMPETFCSAHHLLGFSDRLIRREGNRVYYDAVFGAFDLDDFPLLVSDRQIFVDYADAAFLSERDCQRRICYGVHGRRYERDIYHDVIREAGSCVGLAGNYVAFGGYQQDIIECYTFCDDFVLIHLVLRSYARLSAKRAGPVVIKRISIVMRRRCVKSIFRQDFYKHARLRLSF